MISTSLAKGNNGVSVPFLGPGLWFACKLRGRLSGGGPRAAAAALEAGHRPPATPTGAAQLQPHHQCSRLRRAPQGTVSKNQRGDVGLLRSPEDPPLQAGCTRHPPSSETPDFTKSDSSLKEFKAVPWAGPLPARLWALPPSMSPRPSILLASLSHV